MSYNPYANPYAQGSRYAQPHAGPSQASASSSYSQPDPFATTAYDANLAQQASIYTPEAAKKGYAGGPAGKGRGRTTVLRKGGGTVWEDQTLLEWDPAHFRLFVGDLDPALSDDIFTQSFNKWPSFVKARLVRDKQTNKGRGYGFVAYSDPEDFLKAWKEMNGKYVGTRPCKITKAQSAVQHVNIGAKKARMFDEKRKPKSGTEAYSRDKLAMSEGGGLNAKEGMGALRDKKSYIRR